MNNINTKPITTLMRNKTQVETMFKGVKTLYSTFKSHGNPDLYLYDIKNPILNKNTQTEPKVMEL
ncbi:hypothetical protein Scep_007378 [Stephania cephalantha]|uniref:Uncharacterized protein n=1 Tax=Stephania cephalantha TaxID=152367 RepID=A0AAP0K9V3_9MAGN